MATNFYFNNLDSSQEQTLIEDLIIESIKIYGLDVYYIPRTVVTLMQSLESLISPNITMQSSLRCMSRMLMDLQERVTSCLSLV